MLPGGRRVAAEKCFVVDFARLVHGLRRVFVEIETRVKLCLLREAD